MNLLICGASARAAAASAVRAGLQPAAIDRFADRDLISLCTTQRVPDAQYPSSLLALAGAHPPSGWLYTGALENHPELIDRITERHRLYGNDGATLRAVRDPFRLAAVLRDTGCCCPAVARKSEGIPRDGHWLVKPLASGGGLGIAVADGIEPERQAVYYQERIEGPSFSAVFVADRTGTECAGVTRQLIGRPGAPFAYRGSIGPWRLPERTQERVEALGSVVAGAFCLVGVFGIDFVLNDGQPWPVEVNPRYTASVEVLELASGRALLSDHVRACGARHEAPIAAVESRTELVGKLVVFAERRCGFPALRVDELTRMRPACEPDAVPAIADVPHDGTRFEPGDPVLTVFATGGTLAECLARLELRRREWTARLTAT